MHKKALQIETNFLEEDDARVPIVTTSKINYQEKQQAANLLEKILSLILAKNFIQCWKELKEDHTVVRRNAKRVYNSDMNGNYVREERVHYFESHVDDSSKVRSNSQRRIIKSSVASQALLQDSRNPSRNKSVRVINQQIENSRAAVLQQIVQKLRNARNIQIVESEQSAGNEEMIKKLSHLQRMVKTLKIENKREQRLQRSKRKSSSEEQSNYSEPEAKQKSSKNQQKQGEQEQQLVKSFIKQIEKIRQEINQIKISNETILKQQMERSRLSQFQQKVQLRNTEMQTMKETVSEGVQTSKRQASREAAIHTDSESNYSPLVRKEKRQVDKVEEKDRQKVGHRGRLPIQDEVTGSLAAPNNNPSLIQQQPNKNGKNHINLPPSEGPQTNIPHVNSNVSNNRIQNYYAEETVKDYDGMVEKSVSEINKILKSYQFIDNSSPFPSQNPPTSIAPPFEADPMRSIPQPQHFQNPQIQQTQYVVPTQPHNQQQYQMLPKQVSVNLSQPNFTYPLPPPPHPFLPQTQSQSQLQPQSQPQPQANTHQLPPQPPQKTFQSNAQSQQPVSYRPPSTSNIVIRAGQFEYPRFDHFKTHTTFYSKNNVYSDFGSSSSLGGGGANFYPNHQRNPSIQIQEGLANGNIVFSNYCSACGRSCGCARTFNENVKQ